MKWLIPAHVPAPLHWTLVEVRWKTLTLHFYDSFSQKRGYALLVEERVRALLELCRTHFGAAWRTSDWTWVHETVRTH